ncbi:tRNA dihydrouridine synthase DusB [Guggenheimella bovis]
MVKVMIAPLAGVTDRAYRRILREQGAELCFTEMISAQGLVYDNTRTKEYLDLDPTDHPLAVQIFGKDPEIMAESVRILEELAPFEELNVNMGCPVRKITSNGEGSALMADPTRARSIVRALKKVTKKPVTVKTRIGIDEKSINVIEFAKGLEAEGVDAITVHGRTAKQLYMGRANWDVIKAVKRELKIPVYGNGDIFTLEDYIEKASTVDGVMLARGIQGNPFLVREIMMYVRGEEAPPVSIKERIEVAHRHLLYATELRGQQGLLDFRKHAVWYFKGVPGSAKLRNALATMTSPDEFLGLTQNFLDNQGFRL